MSKWPFVQAKWYTQVDDAKPRKIRVIVIHDMEFYERGDSAEVIANDFATRPATSKASAHVCVDNNSIVQCVRDRDVAYAAPGCNNDGIQIELAGYMNQTGAQWMDLYSVAVLALASDAVAQYAIKYGIPLVHLTNAQLSAGMKGIVGHYQVSQVYKKSDHQDPGSSFPWSYFLQSAQLFYDERTRKIA
jgi:N-acetyl-anhydromuramyl-L-alanine amidase AmpD